MSVLTLHFTVRVTVTIAVPDWMSETYKKRRQVNDGVSFAGIHPKFSNACLSETSAAEKKFLVLMHSFFVRF
jgi:hypothetical protein